MPELYTFIQLMMNEYIVANQTSDSPQVLVRIVSENGGDLVVATLCLIEVSRFGLLETELLELLASTPADGAADTDTKRLPMVHVRKR